MSVFVLLLICACVQHPHKTLDMRVRADAPYIQIMGRTVVNLDSSLTFAYPGVMFIAEVNARALVLTVSSSSGNSWLDIQVDEGASRAVNIAQGQQQLELFRFATAGRHKVIRTHRSESWIGAVTIAQWAAIDGVFLPAQGLPARKLMVLGDSITCGEAIERVPGEAKHSGWWSSRKSYGFLAAQALNAQVHLVCAGGRGLIRSWNGKTDDTHLADFYRYSLGDADHNQLWNEQRYVPDLILMAIGTNDFAPGIPERALYINTYVNFLRRLRDNYPFARIVITEGSMVQGEAKTALVDFLQQTLKQMSDSNIVYFPCAYAPGDVQDAHPTAAQHEKLAASLVVFIRKLMHWE
jgi:hypothetical protein